MEIMVIIEMIMLGAGVYALVNGKLPKFVYGKKIDFQLDAKASRLIGAVLIAPIPLSFGIGVFVAIFFKGFSQVTGGIIETVLIIGCLVVANFLGNKYRTVTLASEEIIEN
jgi:hypothetical protein